MTARPATILVTGARGVIGRAVMAELGGAAIGVTRQAAAMPFPAVADWRHGLERADAVVHLGTPASLPESALAAAAAVAEDAAALAAAAGRRRIVFISSVKVHGEGRDSPYRESDPPAPEQLYAHAKLAAEQALAGPDTVILRPPLVVAPGARGNLRALLRLVDWGVPLPFGAVDNRRSLLALGNLVAAIGWALRAPVGGRCFLLRDGEDLSTPALVRRLAAALGRPARLPRLPPALLRAVLGRARARRLLGSLTVDDAAIRAAGFAPPLTVDDGIIAVAKAWRMENP